jgi:hypothetical protein
MITVKELLQTIQGLPESTPVYLQFKDRAACVAARSVEYSDTLSSLDDDDDSYSGDGVIISLVETK